MEAKFFLSNKFRIPGWFLVILGFILSLIRFKFGIKPSFLDVNVFAFYSSYIETKYFSVIENHISEEIAGCLILVGFLFIVFSKEKNESEQIAKLRNESLVLSVLLNSILMLFGLMFFYGFAFVELMIINIFSLLAINVTVFRLKTYYSKLKSQS